MLITKRDKSGYNKHSKNAKYSSPKIRSIVRTASDMTILKRRGRNLLTFCYGFKIIITKFFNHIGSRIKIQAFSNGSRVLNWFQNSTERYLSFKTKICCPSVIVNVGASDSEVIIRVILVVNENLWQGRSLSDIFRINFLSTIKIGKFHVEKLSP